MADLIAQGAEAEHRWRRKVARDQSVVLGRQAGTLSVPWDEQVSRRHAQLDWDGERLQVRKVPEARNQIFFRGQPLESFSLEPGQHFVIGQTVFTLADQQVEVSLDMPEPAQQHSFSGHYLQRLPFRHADARIEVLSRLAEVITGAQSDIELFVRLVNLMLAGVPRASTVALVDAKRGADGQFHVEVLHWDRRLITADDFHPSHRLIEAAITRHESVLHIWSAKAKTHEFTMIQGSDWASCTPLGGKASAGWAVYVAGNFRAEPTTASSDPTDLRDDLKFIELAASALSSLRDVRMLERERTSLSHFFSPVVLDALAGEDPNRVLEPREADITVLFCDLRGFSRHSEQAADDLLGLLNRVSRALGVTTKFMRQFGGVLGDFHGDAAMGFWGWPLEQPDSALRACQTALAIRREFASVSAETDGALAGFEVGIGIASGRAVAGKIGTAEQVKVTVFGPVVNLASRLEGMTKNVHAPILVDAETARRVRDLLTPDDGRLRRVAVVRPYGMDTAIDVTELLPPEHEAPSLSAADIARYEAALDHFLAGRWNDAFEGLHRVPPADRVKDFLTVLIAQHHRTAPRHWDGVIELTSK